MQVYGVHTGEGTPYEGVRVALMKWAEENRRYEFTPAGSVDGPLITWTPEKQAGAAGPSHTGHDVKPIDQATILVTPIPTGEDEYTTPAFPVPHERDLNDYILVFPADAGMEPIYVYLSQGRSGIPDNGDKLKSNYTLNKNGVMLGANGPIVSSKTLWMGKGKERIDVENPFPGKRAGQIHYQDSHNNKYYYDPVKQNFPDAPKSVNNKLNDPAFKNAIDKGMTKYLGEK